MAPRWDYFVILAGMRTGSNFLEANLSEYPGLACHGELFNPRFIGHAGQSAMFGIDLAAREAHPKKLVRRMRQATAGLAGFRLFDDHDPRVLDLVLDDPRCAKVVLSRNPLDSYVSLQIAAATGQWRLGEMRDAKAARIRFDREDFLTYARKSRLFMEDILHRLQTGGQTAFFLTYDEVSDLAVMNGLARFLGITEERQATSTLTKKQNPGRLEDKVENHAEMLAALADLDPHDLQRYPVFEPKRGPLVPQYVACPRTPLLNLPVRGGPVAAVQDWMARLDGVGPEALLRDFTQNLARQWMREHPGHRSFAVLRHPVPRLYDAFCRVLVEPGPDRADDIRETLMALYEMPFPDDPGKITAPAMRALFLRFAEFVGGNLAGQTSIRVHAAWASQTVLLESIAGFTVPDMVLREDDLARDLPALAATVGAQAPDWRPEEPGHRIPLATIYDRQLEQAVQAACQRDYMMLGFGPWR